MAKLQMLRAIFTLFLVSSVALADNSPVSFSSEACPSQNNKDESLSLAQLRARQLKAQNKGADILELMFHQADLDHNSDVTKEELVDAYRHKEELQHAGSLKMLEEKFDHVDSDQSGSISLKEFYKSMSLMQNPSASVQALPSILEEAVDLDRVFKEADVNHDHELTKIELEKAYHQKEDLQSLGSLNELNEQFDVIDADHDGEISKNEFHHRMTKNVALAAEMESTLRSKNAAPTTEGLTPGCRLYQAFFPMPEGSTFGSCIPGAWLNHEASCNFECSYGYSPNAEVAGQQCVAGTWNPSPPQCNPNPCIVDTEPPTDGKYDSCEMSSEIQSGTECSVSCDSGFTPRGQPAYCRAGIFIPSTMICQPQSCHVTDFVIPTGAHPDAICSSGTFTLTHGAQCSLTCGAGSTPTGTQPSCSAGAFNAGTFACTPQTCQVLIDIPPHSTAGEACQPGAVLDAGASCDLKCDPGYELTGTQPTCVSGFMVPGTITCTPKDCTVTDLPFATLDSHVVIDPACAPGKVIPSGSQCDLSCEDGYSLTSDSFEPFCTAGVFNTGQWGCQPSDCKVLDIPQVPHGQDDPKCTDGSMIKHGASCSLTCDKGYYVKGEQPSCKGGKFSMGSITCVPKDCTADVSPPENGKVGEICAPGQTVQHGSSCQFTCNEGYTISGHEPFCSLGVMEKGSLVCSPKPCLVDAAFAGNVVPGEACQPGALLASGSTCDLSCAASFTLSGQQPSCNAGVFDMGSVTCTPPPAAPEPTPAPVTAAPTPAPVVESTCTIYGDPHIVGFDKSPARHSFTGMGPLSLLNEAPAMGDTWLVKSRAVRIQGRYNNIVGKKKSRSFLRAIAIGGKFLEGNKLIIGKLGTNITWNGDNILTSLPSELHNAFMSIKYHKDSMLVQDPTRKATAPGIDIELPLGLKLMVNRGRNGLAVKITMRPQEGGQDGECGNFNADKSDDTAELISQRLGHGVRPYEVMFRNAFMAPSPVVESIADEEN